MGTGRRSFVAECFWPGVRDEDVQALDERVRGLLDGAVVYRGSMLIRQDEVVLCEFERAPGGGPKRGGTRRRPV